MNIPDSITDIPVIHREQQLLMMRQKLIQILYPLGYTSEQAKEINQMNFDTPKGKLENFD